MELGARGPRGETAAGLAAVACPPPAVTATAPGQSSGTPERKWRGPPLLPLPYPSPVLPPFPGQPSGASTAWARDGGIALATLM